MSGFIVIRHPAAGVGTCAAEALPLFRARGWFRISEPRPENDFHLPEFADVATDLDAPAPDPKPEQQPAKASKEKAS